MAAPSLSTSPRIGWLSQDTVCSVLKNQVQSTPVAQEGQEVREADRTIAIHVGWARRTTRAPSGQQSNQVVEINVPVAIHVSGDRRGSLITRQCGQGKTVHRRLHDGAIANIGTDESDAERCRVGHKIGDQELLAEPATVGFRRVPLHRFQSDPAGPTIGRTLHIEGVLVWGSTIWRRVVVPPPVGHHRRGIAGVQNGRGQNGVTVVNVAVAIPPVVGVVRQVTG